MGFDATDVQKALKGADYPADGEQLAELAESNGADQDLVDALRMISEADDPSEVMEELSAELDDEAE